MRKWGVLAVAVVAALAGAGLVKLYGWSMAPRCGGTPCVYVEVRLLTIRQYAAARAGERVYLVIGDSLTEAGAWPAMCGLTPVPAGISGAQVETWLPHAKRLADTVQPDVVVVALGTNDLISLGQLGSFEALATSLAGHEVIAVPVHQMPGLPQAKVAAANVQIAKVFARRAEAIKAATIDGVHLTKDDYARWFAAIEKTLCSVRKQ